MRYGAEHKEETRKKILLAAGRGFRRAGFGGIGIAGLADGAGVTSGAFYGHFKSKADAFRAAVVAGVNDLRVGIGTFQRDQGERWIEALADFYFTDRVTCDLGDGCALPSLSSDVTRSDSKTKAAFEKELVGVLDALAEGLGGDAADRQTRAIVMAALFAGGVTLARSVRNRALRDRIAEAARVAVVAVARGSKITSEPRS
jgi:AcrR family transcriptional regulator